MRDIRAGLLERLDAVALQRERLRRGIEELDSDEKMLRRLLEAEQKRFHDYEPSLFVRAGKVLIDSDDMSDIARFLTDAMSDGESYSLASLKELAEKRGIFSGEKTSPGRALHFALVNLQRRGAVKGKGDGYWRLTKRDAPLGSTNRASDSEGSA